MASTFIPTSPSAHRRTVADSSEENKFPLIPASSAKPPWLRRNELILSLHVPRQPNCFIKLHWITSRKTRCLPQSIRSSIAWPIKPLPPGAVYEENQIRSRLDRALRLQTLSCLLQGISFPLKLRALGHGVLAINLFIVMVCSRRCATGSLSLLYLLLPLPC